MYDSTTCRPSSKPAGATAVADCLDNGVRGWLLKILSRLFVEAMPPPLPSTFAIFIIAAGRRPRRRMKSLFTPIRRALPPPPMENAAVDTATKVKTTSGSGIISTNEV